MRVKLFISFVVTGILEMIWCQYFIFKFNSHCFFSMKYKGATLVDKRANRFYTLVGSPAWGLVLNPLVAYTSTTVYILRVYSSCFGSSGQQGRETLTGGPPIPSLTLLSLSCRRISLFSCFRRLLSMVDKILDIPISDMFNFEFNDGNSLAGSRGLFVTTLKKYWLNFEMKNSYHEGNIFILISK